jgi:hypothetical protein
LSITTVHASKVGHKGMVYGLFYDKFVLNFAIYCGENEDTEKVARETWERHIWFTK